MYVTYIILMYVTRRNHHPREVQTMSEAEQQKEAMIKEFITLLPKFTDSDIEAITELARRFIAEADEKGAKTA